MNTTPSPTKATEAELFELYCQCCGSVDAMVQIIDSFHPEQNVRYPARATLFRRQDEHNWKERYQAIKSAIHEEERRANGMTFQRINAMAGMTVSGLMKRMADALNSNDPEKLSVFTGELFATMWKIHRTERGLSTSITHQYGMKVDRGEENHKKLTELGYGGLADAVDKLTPEAAGKLMRELGMEIKTPAILQK